MPSKAHPYRLVTVSCFVGIFTQAIITNLTAILFIPLMRLYGFSYVHLGILVGINFASQLSADVIFSGLIDRIGFRRITLVSCAVAVAGLVLFGLTPTLFRGDPFTGFVISTVIFAFSSGLLEVILSPIIDAVPNDDKGPAMSLMHSFYAWGQVATIVLTTLFVHVAGNGRWQIIVFFWALVPLTALLLFSRSKMPPNSSAHTRSRARDLLRNPFYLFALAAILFGGATEVCMNQWTSTFMHGALNIPKVTGDLLGMCGFAAMMGLGRMLYGLFGARLNLGRVLVAGSAAAVLCYLLVALSPWNAVNVAACALTGFFSAILWPGVLVVSSARFPLAGAWMFAVLAAAGDTGAAAAPYITGVVTDYTAGWPVAQRLMELYNTSPAGATMRLGILFSTLFPLATLVSHLFLNRLKRKAD